MVSCHSVFRDALLIPTLDPLYVASEAIADFVERHPSLTNLELTTLSRQVFAFAVRTPSSDVASAIVQLALIAVRDAPEAMRGDTTLPSEGRAEQRVAALTKES